MTVTPGRTTRPVGRPVTARRPARRSAQTASHRQEAREVAFRITGDMIAADEVVGESLVDARERQRLGVRPPDVRSWLLLLVRAKALERVEVADGELARAAAAERSLVDVRLRHGLPIHEIAAAQGLDPLVLERRIRRISAEAEERVAGSVLLRGRWSGCARLDESLVTARVAHAPEGPVLTSHLRECSACAERVRRVVGPIDPPPSSPYLPVAETEARHPSGRSGLGIGSSHMFLIGVLAATAVIVLVASLSSVLSGGDSGDGPAQGSRAATVAGLGSPDSAAPPRVSSVSLRPRTFAWAPVRAARSYRLALYRGSRLVYAARVAEPRLVLPGEWRYGGSRRHLRPGTYRWVVWPVLAGRSQPAKQAVVSAQLVIR